jgi:hypothetical protein
MNSRDETALAVRPSTQVEPWRGTDWQRLWLMLQQRPWTALAVVPASSGAPLDFTLDIALTLARVGMIHLAAPIQIANGTDLGLANVKEFLEEIARCRSAGDKILLALAPIGENPVTETLAQSADCALLCVLFERMDSAGAARTVGKIGRERFVGSTIFRAD